MGVGLISSARRRSAGGGGGDSLADLFASGENGDLWRFDNAHMDANATNDTISAATGLINGLLQENTSGSAGTKPTLQTVSGNDVARFASDVLSYTFGSTIPQPITIMLCLTDTADTANRVLCTGSASGSRCQISINSSGDLIMFAGTTKDTGQNAPINGPKVLTAFFSGTSSYFRVNGTQVATGTAGTQGTNRFQLGQLYDGTFGMTGDIYGALFIDRALTTGVGNELDRAERQLGSYAGITW